MTDKIVVEISLGELYPDEKTFAEYVADRAVKQILNNADSDGLYRGMRARVQKIREEEIREAIRPAIQEALVEALQPTDTWGDAKGEPTTLRAVIVKKAEEELRVPRERQYNKRRTLVEEFVAEEIDRALRKELQAAVDEAKGEVLAALRDKAGEVISETIRRAAAGRV